MAEKAAEMAVTGRPDTQVLYSHSHSLARDHKSEGLVGAGC